MGVDEVSTGGEREALILVAPGFEEGAMVACLESLRREGVAVSLTGLSSRTITGRHGLAVRPDLSIGQLPAEPHYSLVVLPGGRESTNALFADPRVHRLISRTVQGGGTVAAGQEADLLLEEANLITPDTTSNFLLQRGSDLNGFAAQMLGRLR